MSKALSRSQLKTLIERITKLYPSSYADNSWDNTGLLIDCSATQESVKNPKVLLTIDLTAAVAQEALKNDCSLILAYHPFVFPSWKRLSPWTNSQHQSAIQLIQNGVSVYCPHTAVDAAKNGVNDWLASAMVDDQSLIKSSVSIEQVLPVQGERATEVGYGRVVEFTKSVSIKSIIGSLKTTLGVQNLQLALKEALDDFKVQKVALCAGSGSGVFKNLKEDADLYLTGEMSHHEILRLREMGKGVIVCNHSNTERGFLRQVMLKELSDAGIQCIVSSEDCDPLVFV
ncbi:LANO_0D01530g1_1 [Lachancea nothofagi CBS 11611]|uniref:LANO_0D01530g1_1 n=1 Tax=Lachancea nothofagi CBS 11611 TaxID=1266666 RepID=A0A1G4JDJ3_9SACH|nr:LANO_0D01530g1_1 [Lachancea nothofagi CBS 11611]